MTYLLGVGLVFSAIWALIGGIGLLVAMNVPHGSFSLFGAAVAFGPLALVFWTLKRRAGKWKSVYADMLRDAGVAQGAGYDWFEDGTGVALNRQARTLTLLANGAWKTYPLAEVREWETRVERGGKAVGFGVQGELQAFAANASASQQALANTGLFVRVKDVERPMWRVSMSQAVQARWMEILRQEINER